MPLDQTDINTTPEQINAQLVTLTEKYLSNKQYVLSGTETGYIGAEITPLAPYANLGNRYYPTVATLPQISDNLKTKEELGGYFLPQNLGVSIYQARNLTALINTSVIEPGKIYKYIDPTLYNKGRGLTLNDEDNIIVHVENKDWMKSSHSDSFFDGQVVGTDSFQKFIPYQSSFESLKQDDNGVVTVQDDFEYWTGAEKNVWLQDSKATELNWIKYFNSNVRSTNLLILENTELVSWHTDVFGNEYGLYKAFSDDRTIYSTRSKATGTLWVKTADGSVFNATDALSSIYNKYISNVTLYDQLTGGKIAGFQVFFDTLIFDTASYRIYEKIKFDYENALIEPYGVDFINTSFSTSVATYLISSTSLSYTLLPTGDLYNGNVWFNEDTKKFVTCAILSATVTTPGVSSIIVPLLYEYDINNPAQRTRIFPTNETVYDGYLYTNTGAASANTTRLDYIEAPLLTYNKTTNSYFINYIGYCGQYFKLINATSNPNTNVNTLGNVIVTEILDPITDGSGNPILAQ